MDTSRVPPTKHYKDLPFSHFLGSPFLRSSGFLSIGNVSFSKGEVWEEWLHSGIGNRRDYRSSSQKLNLHNILTTTLTRSTNHERSTTTEVLSTDGGWKYKPVWVRTHVFLPLGYPPSMSNEVLSCLLYWERWIRGVTERVRVTKRRREESTATIPSFRSLAFPTETRTL